MLEKVKAFSFYIVIISVMAQLSEASRLPYVIGEITARFVNLLCMSNVKFCTSYQVARKSTTSPTFLISYQCEFNKRTFAVLQKFIVTGLSQQVLFSC